MILIRGALLEQALESLVTALDRHARKHVRWRHDGLICCRPEKVAEALIKDGWTLPTPPENPSIVDRVRMSMVHSLIRGQRITLVVEDAQSQTSTEWTGTVVDVVGSGPVNTVQHIRLLGSPSLATDEARPPPADTHDFESHGTLTSSNNAISETCSDASSNDDSRPNIYILDASRRIR